MQTNHSMCMLFTWCLRCKYSPQHRPNDVTIDKNISNSEEWAKNWLSKQKNNCETNQITVPCELIDELPNKMD
jgi:hypothetical protein